MRKVFISFLGTNNYLRCNYYFNNDKNEIIKNVRFVQEAIIQKYCLHWDENDRIYFFLTDEAKKKNWLEDGQFDKNVKVIKVDDDKQEMHGLEYCLTKKINLKTIIETVDVSEGYSENQIWEIFESIYNKIKNEDIIIFDITHGFRSLPMLGMVLINYLKVLKNIKVNAIFYGAFEALGTLNDAKKINLESRNANVLNLITFNTLLEWTYAADNFIKNGIAEDIKTNIDLEINPILKKTAGKDDYAKSVRSFNNRLKIIPDLFYTVRGLEINTGESFVNLKNECENIKNGPFNLKALKPLVEKIEKKINKFKSNDINNSFLAVDWCLQHGMIQQAITFLQETIISLMLDKNGLNYNDKDNREDCASVFNLFRNDKINIDELINKEKEDCVQVIKFFENNNVDVLKQNFKFESLLNNCKDKIIFFDKYKSIIIFIQNNNDLLRIYMAVQDLRNDINHGGTTIKIKKDGKKECPKKANDFIDKIKTLNQNLQEIINTITEKEFVSEQK